jgi:4-hydroxy-4-methyl-2-oxoglutarate aldolase
MVNDASQAIYQYIKDNRVSTTEIADALGKTGELDSQLKILTPGTRAVGFVHYVPAFHGSNWHTHLYMRDLPRNSVVFVEGFDCEGKAIFGSLVAKFAMLYKGASGLVVAGLLRDTHTLVKEQYPIWCYGASPIGCTNEEVVFDHATFEHRQNELSGSLIVADDSGVIIIYQNQLTKTLLEKLEFIEKQEDIWFDCIDRLKWDTYDTVCLKLYKNFVYPE